MIPVIIAAVGTLQRAAGLLGAADPIPAGTAAAGGIGLINSMGNLRRVRCPYATGALEDLTETTGPACGRWGWSLFCAGLVVALRAAPSPDGGPGGAAAAGPAWAHNGSTPRSQPTG